VRESPAVPRSLIALALGGAALALLAAGCGGAKSYSLTKTRACLAKEKQVRLSSRVDFVADKALGGAVVVKLPSSNQVTIAFALDEDEAVRLANAYRRFHGKNIGIDDVLRPDRNAVLLWKAHPSDQDIASVNGCLE
jgi:hypothetical protein